ncbi:MAG: BON domain-containing protein [Acidobacteriota bacterium]
MSVLVTFQASVGPLPATDTQLEAVVRRALQRNPHLRRGQVKVKAASGEVRLEGQVANMALRRRVFRRVASIRGVLAIDDRITLAGTRLPDRTVDLRLWSRLAIYADLNPPHLHWEVEDGQVTVQGEVSTVGRLLFLRDVMSRVTGVRSLDLDDVEVRSFTRRPLSGKRLRRAIIRMVKDPNMFPIAGHFEVRLQGQQIVLEGRVPRLIDRMEAVEVARLAGRDLEIVDHLILDPSLGRLVIKSASPSP